jgi:hypothetical protein
MNSAIRWAHTDLDSAERHSVLQAASPANRYYIRCGATAAMVFAIQQRLADQGIGRRRFL